VSNNGFKNMCSIEYNHIVPMMVWLMLHDVDSYSNHIYNTTVILLLCLMLPAF
jgi:hypothetical protein